MSKKRRLLSLIVGALICFGVIASSLALVTINLVQANEEYTLLLNKETVSFTSENEFVVKSERENEFKFKVENGEQTNSGNAFINLFNSGVVYNDTAIHGLTSIVVNYVGEGNDSYFIFGESVNPTGIKILNDNGAFTKASGAYFALHANDDIAIESVVVKYTCKEDLFKTPLELSFEKDELVMLTGESETLKVNTSVKAELTDNPIKFMSSNNNVAVVDDNGLVSAIGEGNVTITAFIDEYDISATLALRVYQSYPLEFVFETQQNNHEFVEREFVDFPTFTYDKSEANEEKNIYAYSEGLAFETTEDGKSLKVVRGGQLSTDIFIPEKVGDLYVTEIGEEAFAYYWFIERVYIPKTITKIGAGAFSNSGIRELYYDAEEISDFNGNNWIFYPQQEEEFSSSQMKQNINLVVGPNVKCIPSRLFLPLGTHLNIHPVVKSVKFAKNSRCETIGEYAFYGLENLQSIHLPDSLKTIGEYAFYNTGLKELYLPDNVESISDNAFMFSDKIEHLRMPRQLKEIGTNCFYGLASLKHLCFADTNLNELSEGAFKNCTSLNYLDLGNIKTINARAFENCSALETIYLNDNVEFVGEGAFKNCLGAKNIYLGKNIHTLENNAFEGNVNAGKVFVAGDKITDLTSGNNVFLNLGKNVVEGVEIIILPGVSKIAKRLFFASSNVETFINVKRLYLPTSLLTINEFALYGAIVNEIYYQGSGNDYLNITIQSFNNILPQPVCLEDVK